LDWATKTCRVTAVHPDWAHRAGSAMMERVQWIKHSYLGFWRMSRGVGVEGAQHCLALI
jgi:hypothetical protein